MREGLHEDSSKAHVTTEDALFKRLDMIKEWLEFSHGGADSASKEVANWIGAAIFRYARLRLEERGAWKTNDKRLVKTVLQELFDELYERRAPLPLPDGPREGWSFSERLPIELHGALSRLKDQDRFLDAWDKAASLTRDHQHPNAKEIGAKTIMEEIAFAQIGKEDEGQVKKAA